MFNLVSQQLKVNLNLRISNTVGSQGVKLYIKKTVFQIFQNLSTLTFQLPGVFYSGVKLTSSPSNFK